MGALPGPAFTRPASARPVGGRSATPTSSLRPTSARRPESARNASDVGGDAGTFTRNQREVLVEELLAKERVLVLMFNRAFAGSEAPPTAAVAMATEALPVTLPVKPPRASGQPRYPSAGRPPSAAEKAAAAVEAQAAEHVRYVAHVDAMLADFMGVTEEVHATRGVHEELERLGAQQGASPRNQPGRDEWEDTQMKAMTAKIAEGLENVDLRALGV